jgi:putative ABC transport system substrate-binding protein
MRRRDLLLLGVGLAGITRAASAEERVARIAVVTTGDAIPLRYFDQAMRRLGWIEGRNLVVTRRLTGNDADRRSQVAAELVAMSPDVIVAGGMLDTIPLRAQTRTIPIVILVGSNLVAGGLIESMARPGGNVTGAATFLAELDAKRIEVLHELLPGATRVAMLADPRYPGAEQRLAEATAVARTLGIETVPRVVTTIEEVEAAFAAAAAAGDHAMLVQMNALVFENRTLVAALAQRLRMPAIYELREFVEAGGLVAYGPLWRENFERGAVLVDKILKGAKPAELPIELPTRYHLSLNQQAAAALGFAFPSLLLDRADEVIE